MKRKRSGRIRIVIIAALLLTVGLAVVNNLAGGNVGSRVVQGILTPFRAGMNALTVQAEQFYSYIFRYEALEAENQALRQQIAVMEDDARTADSVSRENERLRALLELKTTHEDYQLVDSYIISRSSNDWTSTFTINRGSAYGIEAGMCAITAHGEVIGLVTEVGSNYAVVKTVLDSSLQISATISSSGYNGMVQGGYASSEEGLLRMDYLPNDAVIRNSDQVVTSGSTVYPRDLILGYVVDADYNDTGVSKYALLRPATDFDSLEQVFILTSYLAE